jgi:hypothetical protein
VKKNIAENLEIERERRGEMLPKPRRGVWEAS